MDAACWDKLGESALKTNGNVWIAARKQNK
jgi:hypothetical protein